MSEEAEKKYKIIMVDDDDFLVNMYTAKFNRNNVLVDGCVSGESLLEKLRDGIKADLILLDIIMPNMSGIETLAKMRQAELAKEIPVVMLTNQNNEKNIEEAKKLGVAGYIIKSAITPSEVIKKVIAIIKNSQT